MEKKRKSKQTTKPPVGAVMLDKPNFEQALSFAESFQPASPEGEEPVSEQVARPSGAKLTRWTGTVEGHDAPHAASLMPQDEASRKVLQERALVLAKPISVSQQQEHDQYLRFRLGTVERYGIPYKYLEELLYVDNLAKVPCTPKFVVGVVNYHGELLTVLDIKQFFRMPEVTLGEEARIIVVKHKEMRAGLLVDAVDTNKKYRDAELSPPLNSHGVSNMEYVTGIHAGKVTLLNMEAILKDPALRVSL